MFIWSMYSPNLTSMGSVLIRVYVCIHNDWESENHVIVKTSSPNFIQILPVSIAEILRLYYKTHVVNDVLEKNRCLFTG
jgi:hypothetical protein